MTDEEIIDTLNQVKNRCVLLTYILQSDPPDTVRLACATLLEDAFADWQKLIDVCIAS